MGDFEDTVFVRGFKSSEKTDALFQAEASPQQAESLATGVRPFNAISALIVYFSLILHNFLRPAKVLPESLGTTRVFVYNEKD